MLVFHALDTWKWHEPLQSVCNHLVNRIRSHLGVCHEAGLDDSLGRAGTSVIPVDNWLLLLVITELTRSKCAGMPLVAVMYRPSSRRKASWPVFGKSDLPLHGGVVGLARSESHWRRHDDGLGQRAASGRCADLVRLQFASSPWSKHHKLFTWAQMVVVSLVGPDRKTSTVKFGTRPNISSVTASSLLALHC